MSKKILVIDDDEDILEIVSITLQSDGFDVISRNNADVLSELATIDPDIILLDNWLGTVEGSELCKKIKASSHSHVAVILFSAINDLEAVAKECKADAFLSKPFNLFELENVVKQFA